MAIRGVLKNVLKASHDCHHDAIAKALRVLTNRGYRVFRSFRSDLEKVSSIDRRFKFVVTVGGDGTFLAASHYLHQTPLLGINSDPTKSVARFSACGMRGFAAVLDAYEKGKVKTVSVARLELRLNGKKHPLKVLNDILVTAHCPAEASRYLLTVGKRTEEQMSSGLWISTAVGSTAASASAGGRILPMTCSRFQYIVREIYHRKTGPRLLLRGVLRRGERISILSRMREGELYLDGANTRVPFELGSLLEVSLSDSPLKVVGLRKHY